MFITLFFFYPASFICCLRSNTKNNRASLLNLSLHFQGWCLTSKSLLGTCINKLCYQNSTTNLHPPKNADNPGTGEDSVLILAVNLQALKAFCIKVCCPCFLQTCWELGLVPQCWEHKEYAVLQSVRAPVFCQAALSCLCCGFQQLPPFSLMFSLHLSPCYHDLASFVTS